MLSKGYAFLKLLPTMRHYKLAIPLFRNKNASAPLKTDPHAALLLATERSKLLQKYQLLSAAKSRYASQVLGKGCATVKIPLSPTTSYRRSAGRRYLQVHLHFPSYSGISTRYEILMRFRFYFCLIAGLASPFLLKEKGPKVQGLLLCLA